MLVWILDLIGIVQNSSARGVQDPLTLLQILSHRQVGLVFYDVDAIVRTA